MPAPRDFRPGLRPPQFSLRTMILAVTVLAVFFSLVNVLNPLALAGLVLLAVGIGAHVAGNAIGTRLRENGNRAVDERGLDLPLGREFQSGEAIEFAPPTQLSRRASLGLPIFLATLAGTILGGAGGGIWGALGAHGTAGWLNITVGIIAFAVLGGLGSFGTFSFAQVLLGAIRQALDGSHPAPPTAQPTDMP